MKKLFALMLSALMIVSAAALAEDAGVVYGTMRIPYDQFYAAEGVAIPVDAVSSATDSKWKNEGLVAGTYNEAHADDDGGNILGVVYPVAISQADLDAVGDSYAFTPLDAEPAAYKSATLDGDALSFSAVQGPAETFDAGVDLTTESRYGDYQINVDAINNADGTSDIGTIYGVLLADDAGGVYALRHLENIWRDSLSFTAGFKTTEGHGNALRLENYAELMGRTITAITYITDSGYHTIETSVYVPVKFDGGASVADAPIAGGATDVTLDNLPEDYAPTYAADGLNAEVADGTMTFSDALPGSYTLTVSDANGVYADLLASFVLTTDILPVAYDADANALVTADGAAADMAGAFIANIATVAVNGEEYKATGKGAVVIVNAEGEIDPEAAVVQGRGADAVATPVFAAPGSYELTVSATGFDQPITFTVEIGS